MGFCFPIVIVGGYYGERFRVSSAALLHYARPMSVHEHGVKTIQCSTVSASQRCQKMILEGKSVKLAR